MKYLEYESTRNEVIKIIEQQKTIVIATSYKERVTARTVYCISNGLTVYFLTSKAYLKYKQIEKNPRVAACFDNVQLEGVTSILGHPNLEKNLAILRNCPSFNDEFMYFAKYKNTVLIGIDIHFIEMWKDGGRECIDVDKRESYRIG